MTIVLDNPDQLQTLFDGVAADFENISFLALLNDEHRNLEAEHRGYWAKSVDPTGKAWEPLSPATVKRKGHDKILIDSRDLRRSLASRTGNSIRTIADEGVKRTGLGFGTDLPYSIFQSTRTDRKPAREHVGFSEGYLEGATERTADYAVKGLKDASV